MIVSKRIVESHKGKIYLDSRVNGNIGCVFCVELSADLKIESMCSTTENNLESPLRIELPPIKINQKPQISEHSTLFIQTSSNSSIEKEVVVKRFKRALIVDDSDLNRKMMVNVAKSYFEEIVQV